MLIDTKYLKQLVINEQWKLIIDYLESNEVDVSQKSIKLTNLWKAYTKINNKEKSLLYLKQALNINSENATLNRAYGDYLYSIADYDRAQQYYKKALISDIENPVFNLKIANTYLKKGLKSKALKYFKIAKKNNNKLNIDSLIFELSRQIKNNNDQASSLYYDDVYTQSQKYKVHGAESVFIKIWDEVFIKLKNFEAESILDFGCGPGQFAEFIHNKNNQLDYIGLDFSAKAIDFAKKKNPNYNFFNISLPQENYDKFGRFDVVVCIEVLEHIENDLSVLKSIPADTKLIMTVPNYDSFGHLRTFKSQEEVRRRYNEFIVNMEIHPIKISEKNIIWIFSGCRN